MSESSDISVSRRAFLRLPRQPAERSIRPPWSDEASIAAKCDGCNECITACPENIIVLNDDKRPNVDFARGACTFCGACAEACPTGALDPAIELQWYWKPEVSSACLSLQGIACRACEDACEPRAIRFRLALGGKSEPVLDYGQCNGCGACEHTCPTGAVNFKWMQPEDCENQT